MSSSDDELGSHARMLELGKSLGRLESEERLLGAAETHEASRERGYEQGLRDGLNKLDALTSTLPRCGTCRAFATRFDHDERFMYWRCDEHSPETYDEADWAAPLRALLAELVFPAELDVRLGERDMDELTPAARRLVLDACRQAPEAFGPGIRFALDTIVDGPHRLLYLVILADLDADAASAALDRFFEGWWLDNASRADLRIGLELRGAP